LEMRICHAIGVQRHLLWPTTPHPWHPDCPLSPRIKWGRVRGAYASDARSWPVLCNVALPEVRKQAQRMWALENTGEYLTQPSRNAQRLFLLLTHCPIAID
jgi:hypothetical protein